MNKIEEIENIVKDLIFKSFIRFRSFKGYMDLIFME